MSFDPFGKALCNYWEKTQENRSKHPSSITHTSESFSPICGDKVKCEARIENDILVEVGMYPTGCFYCDACVAIVMERFVGKPMSEIVNFTEVDLFNLLDTTLQGHIPEQRHYCASMGWRALKALEPK